MPDDDYRRQYASAWASLSWEYDADDTGLSDRRDTAPRTTWLY